MRIRPDGAAPDRGELLATGAQVRALYLIGRDRHGMTDADVDARSRELYGVFPHELTRVQASRLFVDLCPPSGSVSS